MARAQAYTLEGTFAAIVVVLAALVGIQAMDTGPWTSGDERRSEQFETEAEDFLSVAAADGTLGETVRCYKPSKRVFDGGDLSGSPAPVEEMLNHSFDSQAKNYQLFVSYWDSSSGREDVLFSSRSRDALSTPPSYAGVGTHRIALYDDQPVRLNGSAGQCSSPGPTVSTLDDFFVPQTNESSELYNVVEVRLVLW